ncbi:PTS system galactitol-specific IIB component [Enterococcus sp. PF1-24]|uniref:PTS sugar transporter subunit IIB n=1 Tax=unclassified Enterococcus TaxID=2608891 RepID=UPI0024754F39|nr:MULTISPECIES: PTS sugar transporter subunit IIB [unclassified Enterococcus]MDH6364242.1 PTS system galactitol-specific IIB component [Enterococcus sp. PFB1-1]MDH6401399.1 PTS system galactitol-specific IIB component [Enterococcus sp. PF1-24]
MKKLLIMCGTGVATSTVVTGKMKEWLKEKGYDGQVKLYQSKVAAEMNKIDDYDIVVSTTVVPDNIKDKVIMGLPLLTGMGTEALFDEIEAKIKEESN